MRGKTPFCGLVICIILEIFLVGWIAWDYLTPGEPTEIIEVGEEVPLQKRELPNLQYWGFELAGLQTENRTFYLRAGNRTRLEMYSSEPVRFSVFYGNPLDPPYLGHESIYEDDRFCLRDSITTGAFSSFSSPPPGIGGAILGESLIEHTWIVANPSNLSVHIIIRITQEDWADHQ